MERLTNEELAKKFKSNFDLVSYSIKLAENMIKTGRDARVKSDIQNPAMLVIEEILAGKDQFDALDKTSNKEATSESYLEEFSEDESDQVIYERRYKTRQHFNEE
jgi:DNA-directed RNA polymerase subunit omega